MKKLLYLAMLAMMFSLVLAPAALAQSRGPSGADGSFNCEDFDFQEDAQAFFEQDTSDPDGLDGAPGEAFAGEQGVACEELPSRGTPTETPTETPTPQEDPCPDPNFPVETPDGCASSNLQDFPTETPIVEPPTETQYETPTETQYETPMATETPAAPETGTELPDTGGPALLIPASILLMGSGLLGLRILKK